MEPWFAFGGGCAGVWLGAWWLWAWAKRSAASMFKQEPEQFAGFVVQQLEAQGVSEVHLHDGEHMLTLPVREIALSIVRQLEGGSEPRPPV